MSTAYRSFPALAWDQLWNNLPPGITEHIVSPEPNRPGSGTTAASRCLTDGTNFLWASTGDGTASSFDRYGLNDPWPILESLQEQHGVEFVDEHDPRFFDEDDRSPNEDVEPDK